MLSISNIDISQTSNVLHLKNKRAVVCRFHIRSGNVFFEVSAVPDGLPGTAGQLHQCCSRIQPAIPRDLRLLEGHVDESEQARAVVFGEVVDCSNHGDIQTSSGGRGAEE